MTNILFTSKFDARRITKFFYLLFIISIFFPVRYVFPTPSSYVTGLFSDFTSISLYLSDILLFIAFFFTLWSNNWNIKLWLKNKGIIILIIWLILATFVFTKHIYGLNIWFFIKFAELAIVAYGTTAIVSSSKYHVSRNNFLFVFLGLGTLQSIIGLLQFINQSPIGLNLIGEQIIYPNLWGVAKIISDGTTYIRAYGTFPHPNLLSAFLVTTIFTNIYLLDSTTWKRIAKIWLNLALFINILGLTVTFSRGAFLALGVGLIVYFGLILYRSEYSELYPNAPKSPPLNLPPQGGERKKYSLPLRGRAGVGWSLVMVIVSVIIAFILFRPFLLTRATISDQAVVERKIYNQTALNIIKDKPFFGIGVGENVLHMKQYSPIDLNPWQIQPIHNYFLLAAAELGIPGALILIWIFLSHLRSLILNLKSKIITYQRSSKALPVLRSIAKDGAKEDYLLLATFVSFLVLMLFDHYFYTLEQTQILLWVALGLIAAETNRNNKIYE